VADAIPDMEKIGSTGYHAGIDDEHDSEIDTP